MPGKKNKNRWKRCTALVLAGLLLAGTMTEVYAAGTAEEYVDFYGDTVRLYTASDLRSLAKKCSQKKYSEGRTFLLENDIDLENTSLTIPCMAGTFDGQGHKITNLQIEESVSVTGFFSLVEESGQVKNLNVEGIVAPEGEQSYVGGMVGKNQGVILQCTYYGGVMGTDYVGGIAGSNSSTGQILDCVSQGGVQGTHFVGGVTGSNEGVILHSSNEAMINTQVVDENSFSSLEDSVYRIWKSYQAESDIPSATDVGGVAGFSSGIVKNCSNQAKIGYPHVGYNVGGVVGRQCGYLAKCTNTGHVFGRKDVGGIVGQMVPDVSVLYEEGSLTQIRSEISTLQSMLDEMLDGTQSTSKKISSRLRRISAYGQQAGDSAQWMGDYLSDYAEDGINQINDLSATVNRYTQRLTPILKELRSAMAEIRTGMDQLEELQQEIQDEIQDQGTIERIEQSLDAIDASIAELEELLANAPDDGLELSQLQQIASDIVDNVKVIQQELDRLSEIVTPDRLEDAAPHLLDGAKMLGSVSEDLTLWMQDLAGEEFTELSAPSGEFTDQSEELSGSLNAISSELSSLNYEMEDASDALISDMRNLSDQFMVIMNLFLDAIDDAWNMSHEDVYQDVSEEEIAEIVCGKVFDCSNQGIVEGDVNVGGVAGSMAMEYDLDPEDDDSDAEHKSYRYTYQTKAVLQDCVNEGETIAKKNCVGGIVGRMDLGIVSGAEAYGMISSTLGDYVGGVCGYSLSTIRSSYAKCTLSGRKYVGGIVGSGDTVKNCISMIHIDSAVQFAGAVAGEITGSAQGNQFVSEELAGIDRISYEGEAEPVAYESLLLMENLPRKFYSMTVTFRTDDSTADASAATGTTNLKNYEYHVRDQQVVAYGEALPESEYPEVQCPEGYYLVWDQTQLNHVTMDCVVTGTFQPYDTLLASRQVRKDDRPALLVEGTFKEGQKLSAELITSADEGSDRKVSTEKLMEHLTPWKKWFLHGEVVEQWKVSCPEDGNEERLLRYYLGDTPAKKLRIFVKRSDGWYPAKISTSGSYVLINMSGETIEFAVMKLK